MCSGIHRSLGVHISKVRSTSLDTWSEESVAFMAHRGNEVVNSIFLARVPPDIDTYQVELNEGEENPTRETLEAWIHDKYASKLYCDNGEDPRPVVPEQGDFVAVLERGTVPSTTSVEVEVVEEEEEEDEGEEEASGEGDNRGGGFSSSLKAAGSGLKAVMNKGSAMFSSDTRRRSPSASEEELGTLIVAQMSLQMEALKDAMMSRIDRLEDGLGQRLDKLEAAVKTLEAAAK